MFWKLSIALFQRKKIHVLPWHLICIHLMTLLSIIHVIKFISTRLYAHLMRETIFRWTGVSPPRRYLGSILELKACIYYFLCLFCCNLSHEFFCIELWFICCNRTRPWKFVTFKALTCMKHILFHVNHVSKSLL